MFHILLLKMFSNEMRKRIEENERKAREEKERKKKAEEERKRIKEENARIAAEKHAEWTRREKAAEKKRKEDEEKKREEDEEKKREEDFYNIEKIMKDEKSEQYSSKEQETEKQIYKEKEENNRIYKIIKKCSSKGHNDIDSICYCSICKIYMCRKCEILHSNLLPNHQNFIFQEGDKEIFTGFCKEENHNNQLEYFCKTHNQLCCAACIAKIIKRKNGKHKDCEICAIEDIKDEKINILKENIKSLEILSNSIIQSINNLKILFEETTKNKEELKIKIQKIFTKLRNELNNREEVLLLEVDNKFENLNFKEDVIKESEKLPNKIKISLEKGKSIDKEYYTNKNKLCFLINVCLNLEKETKEINTINKKIEKYNNYNNCKITFSSTNDNEVDKLLKNIKSFGILNE